MLISFKIDVVDDDGDFVDWSDPKGKEMKSFLFSHPQQQPSLELVGSCFGGSPEDLLFSAFSKTQKDLLCCHEQG